MATLGFRTITGDLTLQTTVYFIGNRAVDNIGDDNPQATENMSSLNDTVWSMSSAHQILSSLLAHSFEFS